MKTQTILNNNSSLISQSDKTWILNNGKGTNQIATWKDLSPYAVPTITKCPTYSQITASSNIASGYEVTVSGSYSNNQCVKYSDIKYALNKQYCSFKYTYKKWTCDFRGLHGDDINHTVFINFYFDIFNDSTMNDYTTMEYEVNEPVTAEYYFTQSNYTISDSWSGYGFTGGEPTYYEAYWDLNDDKYRLNTEIGNYTSIEDTDYRIEYVIDSFTITGYNL